MKKFYGVLCFVFISATAMSQTAGSVKGKLLDTTGHQSLKDATVSILNPKDSTLEKFVLSKEGGVFQLNNVAFGTYLLKISFKGYFPFNKNVEISQTNPVLDLGNLYMKVWADTLPEVIVKESPIKMKGDTTEYTAGAYATKPNAVAEDLIAKMPGFDVDKNGNIKHGGETVTQVTVDGKKFFGGNDPKMATRNLPPDVIDKIQVFDDQSDQSKFTGFDDGNRVKTINIVTKKDKRKGYFGKVVGGAGTEGTYDASVNMNRFNGNQQISVIGQANNINKQNFTSQNIGGGRNNVSIGGSGSGAGSSGITTTYSGGLNYRDAWGKNTEAYGSYFYNNQRTDLEQQSLTQNLIASSDSSNFIDKYSGSQGNVENHRLNFNLESKIDSANSIVFRPNITFQNSKPVSSSQTTTTGGELGGTPINSVVTKNHSVNSGYNISGANLQFRHRFAKKYRTLSLDLGFSNSYNKGDGYNYSINTFYKPFYKIDTLNQYYNDTSKSFSFNPTISYTEPLGKNQILELRYSFSYNENNSINNTYRYDNTSKGYTRFDSLFSNSYNYLATTSNVMLSYRFQQQKYNFNIGTGIQFTDLTSDNITKNVLVSRNYINITPQANFTYNFARTQALRIFYNGRTGQPSVSQLQPIATTSDSINFQVGNPNLNPQFTHTIRALFNSFDPVTQKVMFASVNATVITNDIQSVIVNKLNGGRTTSYTNLNGTYNVNGSFTYGFPLKKPKSNLNFITNIAYNQSQSLVIDSAIFIGTVINNYTRNTTLGENIRWSTNLKDNFDMSFAGGVTYNIARYTMQPTQNANYFSYNFSVDATYYTNSGWIVAAGFDYSYQGNRPAGYNISVPLITPSVAKQFLKNKAGELRLSCFDLLDANKSSTRTISGNTIVDTRTNVLTRYFMLTFTYNLRNFASGRQGQGGQQRMPGFFGGGNNGGGNRGGGNFGGGRNPE